jgi:hypothetical protein
MPIETSSSSSSSSEPISNTKEIYQVIAGKEGDDLIFFTYEQDQGFQGSDENQELSFSFRTVNNGFFNYQEIVNQKKSEESVSTSNCYVPEGDDVNIKSDPVFYVDLIVKNSGVKDISVRAQEERYKDNEVKYSYLIPKFEWDKGLMTGPASGDEGYTPLEGSEGSFWAGTLGSKLHKVEYNSEIASSSYSRDEGAIVRSIVNNPGGNEIYITTKEKIKKYNSSQYLNDEDSPILFFTEENSKDNQYSIISLYKENLFSVLPELGLLQELDPSSFDNIGEASGFDAPFKVVFSDHHNSIFIAGTNILWKYDGEIAPVYSISGYEIADFDISKNGEICISFNTQGEGLIRIIDRNFFRILFEKKIKNGKAAFCKFSQNNFFHALAEIDIGGDQFIARNFLYNTTNGKTQVVNSPNILFEPDPPPDESPATGAIEITYPNGGEEVQVGSEVKLTWKSNKSIADKVEIELYRGGESLLVISPETSNTGSYYWNVPETLPDSDDYKLKIQWLAAEVNEDNEDLSGNFSILETLTPKEEGDYFLSAGIDYDKINNHSIVVLKSGLIGIVEFEDFSFKGWIDSEVKNITTISIKNQNFKPINEVSKVRIFVGSSEHLSNKWDSGIISTDLSCIYYGGGDNLLPGETYYVNIQVFSEENGWSRLQTKKFIMPMF